MPVCTCPLAPQALIPVGTSAEKILTLLASLLDGRMPQIEDIIAVREVCLCVWGGGGLAASWMGACRRLRT